MTTRKFCADCLHEIVAPQVECPNYICEFESQETIKESDLSPLGKLYTAAKDKIYYDEEAGFKFSFAFALLEFCSQWHGGQSSELYALMSALSIEWEFSPGMDSYDSDDYEQNEVMEFLIDHFKVEEAS